ncbi:paraquat-inducible protein A [Noviherbaspirillum humi]|uniref:Paraquat-inducible protein A n=1 Tax=Noviherbaspirillum humi TaxID=1688639 RepID=A0A239F780_9BURK|nr:paraquat-inducible protein A [Noviherbaspirillum humi]SNS52900.1 paraquat-inducible protein A [Noviherbaspirillum humi]
MSDNQTALLHHQHMIACRHCDLLQAEVPLQRDSDAHCVRCGALLYRGAGKRLEWMLALTLGSAVLLVVSNLFPIAELQVQGAYNSTTLAGTVVALADQGRPLVAVLVLLTTILIPALELVALLYMLVPLRLGRVTLDLPLAFRLLLMLHPWSMMEVFLLAILVTLVKLADIATIVPGISLWSFAALIVLFTGISATFSVRDFWTWVAERGQDGEGGRAGADASAAGMQGQG